MPVASPFVDPLDDVDSSVCILEDGSTSFRHAGEDRRGMVACFLNTIYRPQPFSVPQTNRSRYLENLLAPIDSILPPSAPSPLEISSSIYADTAPLVGAWEKEILLFDDNAHGRYPSINAAAGDVEKSLDVYFDQHGDTRSRNEPTLQARPLSTLVWSVQPDEGISANVNRYHKPTGANSVSITWNLHLTPGKLDPETCKIRPQVLCTQDLAPTLRPPSTVAKFLSSYLYILPPELRGAGAIHTYGYAALCSTKASDVVACPAWEPAMTHAPEQLSLTLAQSRLNRHIAGAKRITYQLDQKDGEDRENGENDVDCKPVARLYKPNSYLPRMSAGSSECSGPPPSTAGSQNGRTSSKTSISDGQRPRAHGQYLSARGSDEGDEDDEQEDQVQPPSKANTPDEELLPLLACPYYKNNVSKYRNVRCCCGPGWRTIHRLKGHLFDRHSHNRRCSRCQQTFKSPAKFSQHQRSSSPCLVRQCIEDLMSDRQEDLVKRRMQSTKFPTEEAKWREIYIILHEPDDLSHIPSPYYDNHPTSPNTPSPDFANFLNSLKDSHSELGRYTRGNLNLLIGECLPSIEDAERAALGERFVNMFHQIANFWTESQRRPTPLSRAPDHGPLPPQVLAPQPQEDCLDPRFLETPTAFSQYPPFPLFPSVTNVNTHILSTDPTSEIFMNSFDYAAGSRSHMAGLVPALHHLGVTSPASAGPQSFEMLSNATSSPPPSNPASFQVPNNGGWGVSWTTSNFPAQRQPEQRRMPSEDEAGG